MNVKRQNLGRALQGIVRALPIIPYFVKRQRTSVATYVLGGVAIAIAGGLVAAMLLSPRTRSRAIGAARGTYDKVNEKISHLRRRDAGVAPMSNGLVEGGELTSASGI